MKYGLICFCLLSIICCTSDDTDQLLQNELKIYLGESEKIEIHESEVVFSFTNLIMDARCPATVNCIWSGPAIIHLRQNIDTTYLMGLDIVAEHQDSIPFEILRSTYVIHLLEIDCDNGFICPDEDYYIKIRVDER